MFSSSSSLVYSCASEETLLKPSAHDCSRYRLATARRRVSNSLDLIGVSYR